MSRLRGLGLLAIVIGASLAQADCLQDKALVQLDSRYEEALRVGDRTFLQSLLADDFLWVHNLASAKEGKVELMRRLSPPAEIPKARESHNISIHRVANVAVLSGLSDVDKWNADGKTWRTSRYQFMRTYVKVGQECKLLSVQTMKVWSSENR